MKWDLAFASGTVAMLLEALVKPTSNSPEMNLWGMLPRDVRTEQLFANSLVFRIKPLNVKTFSRGAESNRGSIVPLTEQTT